MGLFVSFGDEVKYIHPFIILSLTEWCSTKLYSLKWVGSIGLLSQRMFNILFEGAQYFFFLVFKVGYLYRIKIKNYLHNFIFAFLEKVMCNFSKIQGVHMNTHLAYAVTRALTNLLNPISNSPSMLPPATRNNKLPKLPPLGLSWRHTPKLRKMFLCNR